MAALDPSLSMGTIPLTHTGVTTAVVTTRNTGEHMGKTITYTGETNDSGGTRSLSPSGTVTTISKSR